MKLAQNRIRLLKIMIGAAVFAFAIVFRTEQGMISLMIYVTAYVIIGGNIILKAVKHILHGQIFDENFLMSIATGGAFAVGDYREAVAVMLFYQVGELFQSYAVDRSRKSIANLMDIRPEYANVLSDGALEKVDPNAVKIGDIIVIKAGEKIPLDADVVEGKSTVDTSALTGESDPRDVATGDSLISGCINLNGLLTARVVKEFGESAVSKILELVENAASKKSRSESFITKFARYYTPAVVGAAVLLAVIPPLVLREATFDQWIYRALTFLVVSCPCALVMSIPLSFFGGIGGASRSGILVKGGNELEALSQTEIVVFDKTGTLTKGVFRVQQIVSQRMPETELLELAAYAESFSNHPIALSLRQAHGGQIDNARISEVEEISGHGVLAHIDGKSVAVGSIKLLERLNIPYRAGDSQAGTLVHIAVNGNDEGFIVIADELKDDALETVRALKRAGIKKIVMLTGDTKTVAQRVASALEIDTVYAELLPADKVQRTEELLALTSPKGKLVFVGDGVNDAPVLARADIGVAMGGLGSDAAIEAADVVIMTDEPSKLIAAMRISKKTLRVVKQNIVFALSVKAAVLILVALGLSSMWEAVFADVGVAVLAILNAMRVMNAGKS